MSTASEKKGKSVIVRKRNESQIIDSNYPIFPAFEDKIVCISNLAMAVNSAIEV